MSKMNKKTAAILSLLLLCGAASAYDPTQNMNLKWKYSISNAGGAFTLADLNGDGYEEVVVGLQNNTILVLDRNGKVNASFNLANMSKIGRIYSMAAADFNGDNRSELVLGLGGLKVVETFQLYGFTAPNASAGDSGNIEWQDKVLYQTMRYIGAVYYMDADGSIKWKKSTYNSVLDVGVDDFNGDGYGDILAGVGDYGLDVYSEETDFNYTTKNCTEELVENEYYPVDKDQCTCDGCTWDSSTEECYITYYEETCVITVEVVPGRQLVEYPIRNGTALIYDKDGNQFWRMDMLTYVGNTQGTINDTADNNVRVVYSADVNMDGTKDLLLGTDGGGLYVFNVSGRLLWNYNIIGGVTAVYVSQFNATREQYVILGSNNGAIEFLNSLGQAVWRAKLKKSVESIDVSDIDSDGMDEIIIGSGDGNIYVYDSTGINEWYYPTGTPIYYLKSTDIDKNGYVDVVVGSARNVTLYEMNVDYVLRQTAKFFYDKSEEYFSVSDYTVAMIYATKSKDLYLKVKDAEGITRCDALIKKINDELRTIRKFEADALYDRAVAAYARSEIDNSLVFIQSARKIYVEIHDEVGTKKCDSLKAEIDKFKIAEQVVIAESHYARALNLFSFRNYTEALSEVHASKSIYEEIGYYNGTLTANRLINGIGDAYYTDSEIQLSLRNFNNSILYAQEAFKLYNETKNYDGTAKTEVLMQEIQKRMQEPPVEKPEIDYTIPLYALLAVVVIVAVLQLHKKRSSEKLVEKKMAEEKKPEEDELRFDF